MTLKSLSSLNDSRPYAIYKPTCEPQKDSSIELTGVLKRVGNFFIKTNFFKGRQKYHAVTDKPEKIAEVKLDIDPQLAAGEALRKAGEQLSQQLNATGKFQPGYGRMCNSKALFAAGGFTLIGAACYWWLSGQGQPQNRRSAKSSTLLPPVDAPLALKDGPRVAELRSAPADWHKDEVPLFPATPLPLTESQTSLQPVSESEFQQRVFEEQTRRLKELLLTVPQDNKSYLAVDRDSLLYIAHYPLRSLVNRVISFINKNEENLSRIATLLLNAADEYGGNNNEIISSRQQRAAINAWLNQAILGMPLDIWCLKQAQEMKTQHNLLFDHAHLQRQFFNVLNHISGQEGLSAEARTYYQNYVVMPLLPTLQLQLSEEDRTALAKMDISRPEWGYLHAGARLLYDTGTPLSGLTLDQIEEVGIMLDSLLREGALPPDWIRYFVLPALFHAVRENPGALADISAQEMIGIYRRYFTFANLWLTNNNPFLHFSQAASQWKTRPQLARQLLKDRGVPETWLKIYLDQHQDAEYPGAKGKVSLPNIDEIFKQQNRELADLFRNTDHLLLFQTFNALDVEEKKFIAGADVRRVRAEFGARKTLYYVPLPPAARQGMEDASALRYSVPDTIVLLQCTRDGEERIYALEPKQEEGGYALIRTDRDREKLLFLLNDDQVPRQDSDYQLVITPEAQLKKSAETLEKLQDALAEQHREQLISGLWEQGYEKTLQDKIGDFFLNLVPFYSCVKDKEWKACVMDVVGLLPVVGKAAQLGNVFSRSLGRATLVSLQYGLKQATLSHMLKQGSRKFVGQLPHIAREISPEMYGLGLSAIRFSDPGAELVMGVGKESIKTLRRMITRVKVKGPALTRMAKALKKKVALQKAPVKKGQKTAEPGADVAALTRQEAFDPQLNKQVQVAQVGQAKNGQKLWVKVIPGTGDLAGKRYYLTAAGALEPVPLRLNDRLYMITHEGLGGRGGPKAAAEAPELHRQPPEEQPGPSQNDPLDNAGQNLRKRPPEELAGPSKKNRGNGIPSQFSRIWVIGNTALEVRSVGDKTAESILYPEIEEISLSQKELDAIKYGEAVAALEPKQRDALREWTAFEGADKSETYSDGERAKETGKYFKLNSKLAEGEPLTAEEQQVYDGIMGAFASNSLPKLSGDHLRIGEYRGNMVNPWETGQIQEGDYVTNAPLFMSVSADSKYAKVIIEDPFGMNKNLKISGYVLYKISNKNKVDLGPIPLWAYELSISRLEKEAIFEPGSVFRVKGIAHATPLMPKMEKSSPVDYDRTGVILEQVSPKELAAAGIVSAKNLFTGKEVPLFPQKTPPGEPGSSGAQAQAGTDLH